MRVNNIIKLTESILSYYDEKTTLKVQVDVDAAAVGRNGDVNELCKLLTLTMNLLMTCDNAQQFVTVLLTKLSYDVQNDLKCAIEAVSDAPDAPLFVRVTRTLATLFVRSCMQLGLVDQSKHDDVDDDDGGVGGGSASNNNNNAAHTQVTDLQYMVSELKSTQQGLEAALEAAVSSKRILFCFLFCFGFVVVVVCFFFFCFFFSLCVCGVCFYEMRQLKN